MTPKEFEKCRILIHKIREGVNHNNRVYHDGPVLRQVFSWRNLISRFDDSVRERMSPDGPYVEEVGYYDQIVVQTLMMRMGFGGGSPGNFRRVTPFTLYGKGMVKEDAAESGRVVGKNN